MLQKAMTIAFVAAILAVPAGAQAPIRAGGFVTMLGEDTFSVEKYRRTAARLEGDILTPMPRAVRVHYVIDFDAQGNARELNLTARLVDAPREAPPVLERRSVVVGDSVRNEIRRSGRPDTVATGTLAIGRGAIPFIANSAAVQEEVAHVWRRSGRDSTTYATFVFGPQGSSPAVPIKRFRGDTLVITLGQGQAPLLYLDDHGLLQVLDARMTTVQTLTRRVEDPDMEAIALQFANMGMVGVASPRDTVAAQVGAASITIDYGRPSARGRQVFGGMVELGKVWRTGANLATHFTTSRDLMIGSQHVPAGSYTLWTIPGTAGDTLILNGQTGQWGTLHDPARDFARIPLQTERLPQPVEQFTIAIEPAAGGDASAMLTLSWETRRMRVPIVAH